MNMQKSKRILRGLGLAGMLAVLTAGGAYARSSEARAEESHTPVARDHRLVLFNTHTNERLDIVFRRGEEYVPAALAKLDYFLRDHNTNEVLEFDPHEYDLLYDLTAAVGKPGGEIALCAATALRQRMRRCANAPTEWPYTACTFKRKLLICGCLGLTHSRCGGLLWR